MAKIINVFFCLPGYTCMKDAVVSTMKHINQSDKARH